MTAQCNQRHANSRRNATWRHPVASSVIGALLATLLASTASAQQEVGHRPFEARTQAHASSPNQAMETTTHAPRDMAILRNKQAMTVPKPQQPRQPKQACPPGYSGTYPHCEPRSAPRNSPQQPSHTRYMDVSHAPSSTFKPTTHKPPHVYTAKQRSLHAPTGPGPMHAGAANHANSHGIIFVGGHAQPLQPGAKQSLNPQPIPPGHAVRRPTPPGAPIQRIGH